MSSDSAVKVKRNFKVGLKKLFGKSDSGLTRSSDASTSTSSDATLTFGSHVSTEGRSNASVAFDALRAILKTVENFSDSFPPVHAPIAAINMCIDVYQKVQGNHDEMETQLKRCETLSRILAQRLETETTDFDTFAFRDLTRTLDEARIKLGSMISRGVLKQYISNSSVAGELDHLYRTITDALNDFQLELGLRQDRMTADILKTAVLSSLEYSRDAPFTAAIEDDKVERGPCSPGTRVELVNEICRWANDPDPEAPSLYWLYGLAGTGKTTIAYSVCKRLREQGVLASSYFCSLQLDSNRSKLIAPTIARHLASRSRSFAQLLVRHLQADPDLAHAGISFQVEHLISNPWKGSAVSRANLSLPPQVVVIDALDECDSGSLFLQKLLDAVRAGHLNGIRFLVTSRPEPELSAQLMQDADGLSKRRVALHEMSQRTVRSDIARYLQSALSGSLEDNEIETLAEESDGLFIFASTIVKYIYPPGVQLSPSDSRSRLKDILPSSSSSQEDSDQDDQDDQDDQGDEGPSPTGGIDRLYQQIVSRALRRNDFTKKEYEKRRKVLHMVISVLSPTPQEVIAHLSGVPEDVVVAVVRSLHSVLYTSKSRIYVYHASFHDFIMSSPRSKQFCCSARSEHLALAKGCFAIMKQTLRFNICDLPSSFISDDHLDPELSLTPDKDLDSPSCMPVGGSDSGSPSMTSSFSSQDVSPITGHRTHLETPDLEIPDSPTRIKVQKVMGDILVYACSNWNRHLGKIEAELDEEVFAALRDFFHNVVLFWVEAMSLLNDLSFMQALSDLSSLQLPEEFLPWVKDVQALIDRFLSISGPRITSHLYLSALSTLEDTEFILVWKSRFSSLPRVSLSPAIELDPASQQTGSSILSVAISPDETHVVSASIDGTIQRWNAETGKALSQPFRGHTSAIRAVAFSPDGQHVASCSDDCTIRIWNVSSGQIFQLLRGHQGPVNSIAFSPNGRLLVSASDDLSVRCWDFLSGKETVAPVEGHSDPVKSVAFSPAGTIVASASEDRSIRIWDSSAGWEQVEYLTGHHGSVNSIGFSADGKLLVSSSDDCTVRIWEVETAEEVWTFRGHEGMVHFACFSSDGSRVASGSSDCTIRIWDVDTGEEANEPLRGHTKWVNSVVFSPDGRHLISASDDRTVRTWDVHRNQELINSLQLHPSAVNTVSVRLDGASILSGSDDHGLRIWDTDTGLEVVQNESFSGPVHIVAFSPDASLIVSSFMDCTLRIHDVKTGEETVPRMHGHSQLVNSLAFSPDGRSIVSGSSDHSVRLWDAISGQERLSPMEGHGASVNVVCFSPDSNRVVSGSSDGTVRLWEGGTGDQLLPPLEGQGGAVYCATYSLDGVHVVSGSDDGSIQLWDTQTGGQIWKITGHTGCVYSVAFSPDGLVLLSGSDDCTIRIWDVETGKKYLAAYRLRGHMRSVNYIDFFRNGARVVSCSTDRSIRIWEMDKRRNCSSPLEFRSVAFYEPSEIDRQEFISEDRILHLKVKRTSSYYIRDDGWIVTSKDFVGAEEKLLWLPASMRTFDPRLSVSISQTGLIEINFGKCILGSRWNVR